LTLPALGTAASPAHVLLGVPRRHAGGQGRASGDRADGLARDADVPGGAGRRGGWSPAAARADAVRRRPRGRPVPAPGKRPACLSGWGAVRKPVAARWATDTGHPTPPHRDFL